MDRNTFTCCVGIRPSAASYYLHDEIEVISIVQALATCSRYMQTYTSGQVSPSATSAPLSPVTLPDLASMPTQKTSSGATPTAFASLKTSTSGGKVGGFASQSGSNPSLRNRGGPKTGNLAAMMADMSDSD